MKNIWRVIGLLKELHGRIILVVFTTLVIGLGNLAVPYAFKLIVDEVTKAVGASAAVAMQRIGQLLLILAIIQVVLLVFGYIQEYLEDTLRLDIFFGLRERMMKHSVRLSLDYYETHQAGKISDQMTQGIFDVGIWVDQLAQSSLLQIVSVILALIIIGISSPIAGVIIFIVVLIKLVITIQKLKHINVHRKESRERYLIVQGMMVETISNIATVRTIASEKSVLERFEVAHARLRQERQAQILLERRYNAVNKIFDGIGLVLVIGIIATGAVKGTYTVGDILLVSVYFTNIMNSLSPLVRFFDQTADVDVTAAGIVELLDVKPTVVDAPGATVLTQLESIEFKDVSFNYPGHKAKVLDSISFIVSGNKTVALVGPSGTGKTTITKLLMRFYEPTSGQILINGKDISSFTADSLRSHYGVVMQDVALFNSSFEDNLRLARPEATQAELDHAMDSAHLREFLDELPEGYQTQVGERGIKLSGGQKQRVAIARAMLRDPQLIVLDEATSALDSESERAVQAGLDVLMKDRMAVIIAHRLSTVRHADEIIVIKRGKIMERGDHDHLIKTEGLYYKLYNMQGKL